MPLFQTSTGPVEVANWGYQLQDSDGLDAAALAQASHDLIVMDFSADGDGANKFTAAEISAIKDGPGGRTVAVAYMSIGEASEFRDHWETSWTVNGLASGALTNAAPDWLGATNPDWPESRKVRFWDGDWQDNIYNDAGTGWLDEIVAQGFDAAYLDIVDAYYYWAVEVPNSNRQIGDPAKNDELDAAQRMIDFVVEMTAHAREANPDFFVILQNGAFIMDALEGTDATRKAALLDATGAIAVEDTYYTGGKDQNNRLNVDNDTVKILQKDFLANDIPVFVVDYVNKSGKINGLKAKAIADGFIPYAAHERDLTTMDDTLGGGTPTSKADYLTGNSGNNRINGLKGSDVIEGFGGRDILKGGLGRDHLLGGKGNDRLQGGAGKDVLRGNEGRDRLAGDKGDDQLTGGKGADTFVFRKGSDKDKVLDFKDNLDTIALDDTLWRGVKTAEQVLDQFGSKIGNAFVLDFGEDDILTIKGATKAQLLDDLDII